MKITIDKQILHDVLNRASKFTSTKISSSAILQGIFILAKNKEIHFYATNLNSYFHTHIKTKDPVNGKAVFDPKKIIEFLSLLNAGRVSFELKASEITLEQEKTKGSFPLLASDEFPLPPQIQEKTQKIPSNFFTKNLPFVLFAASTDDARPVLTSINFTTQDEELIIVATDGFRLSLLKLKKDVQIPQSLVPSGFLQEIVKYAKDQENITLSYSEREKMLLFQIGETDYYTRLIEGEFPPYERVIPQDKKTTITLDREDFLRNIKIISLFARDVSNIVVCEFTKKGLYVRPKTEKTNENSAFAEIEFEGEDQSVAFNARFLSDFLSTISVKQVTIEILRPDAPVLFRLPGNKNFLHIIMPVRIQT